MRDNNYKIVTILHPKDELRQGMGKVVVTNGCFDIIHRGHVEYLLEARMMGSCLIVGLNGDASVRKIKGKNRPINSQEDRAAVLAGFYFVDFIYIFEEESAARFLTGAQPDIYVKGGDYSLESMDQEERKALESVKSEIVFLPFVEGQSTTEILEKLKNES